MSVRQILIGILIFATLVIPIVQLSFGFKFINDETLCPIQHDIMLLMAIGGVFELIFFAATYGFIYKITPVKYKKQKNQSVAQQSAKGSNRASSILIGNSIFLSIIFLFLIITYLGCITGIFGACAIMFFVLIQLRVYQNYTTAQWTTPNKPTYCLFTIFSSAFGLMIATYVAFLLLFITSFILLCGICVPKT